MPSAFNDRENVVLRRRTVSGSGFSFAPLRAAFLSHRTRERGVGSAADVGSGRSWAAPQSRGEAHNQERARLNRLPFGVRPSCSATGVADKKRAANRLVVDEATNDDNSIISVSEKKVRGGERPASDSVFDVGRGRPPGPRCRVERAHRFSTPNRRPSDRAHSSSLSLPPVLTQLEELQLFRGDMVRMKGKRGKETVCIVLGDDSCDDNSIKMNKVSSAAPVHSGKRRVRVRVP